MEHINLEFTVQRAFGNLYRKRAVLIAVEDANGKILVGMKPMYPPTISRLLGGGVNEGEDVKEAASRELEEELGIKISPAKLAPLLQFNVTATDSAGEEFHHTTYIYHTCIGNRPYQAGDDVSSVLLLSLDELSTLGERFEKLSDVLWYNGTEGTFSWADYAKLYGPVHKLTAEKLKQQKTISSYVHLY